MLGLITGAAILLVAHTSPAPTQAERHPITLNGHPIEVLGQVTDRDAIAWERDAQSWTPCPPLMADPGGPHPKSRYAIAVNGHRAEVLGWVDPDGFKWLDADQAWSAPPTRPTTISPTGAMANGVVASKLDQGGKVTASDPDTQVAVESLIEAGRSPDRDVGRLKPPSLKRPSLFPAISWAWIAAALLLVASLGFVGLAFLLALWLILKRNRT